MRLWLGILGAVRQQQTRAQCVRAHFRSAASVDISSANGFLPRRQHFWFARQSLAKAIYYAFDEVCSCVATPARAIGSTDSERTPCAP